MNEESAPRPAPSAVGTQSPLLQGCAFLLITRFGAVPNEIGHRDGLGETLSYLYDPGNRGEFPIYFPQARKWCIQAGRAWLRFSAGGKVLAEFEDDLTPALRLSFDHPEEALEIVEFLEVATQENLALCGEQETELKDWLAEFSKVVPASIDWEREKTPPLRAPQIYVHPERNPLTPFDFIGRDMEFLDHPFICAERNQEASLLATMDLLESPGGKELISSIGKGPESFRERAKEFFSGRLRGITPFLQTRDSIAMRATRHHFDHLKNIG